MRISPAFSFTGEKDGTKLEADFALFWQEAIFGERREGLAFGECKTYRRFEERDFKRMRDIAKACPGAVLVFSTLRKLTEFEIKKIGSIAKRGRKYWKSERPLNPVCLVTNGRPSAAVGRSFRRPRGTRASTCERHWRSSTASRRRCLPSPSFERAKP